MDDPAFREDALRQRAASRPVCRFRPRDGRIPFRRRRARHRRLDDARDARRRRRFLLEPRRRQRRRGRQVLRLVAGRDPRASFRRRVRGRGGALGSRCGAELRRSRVEPPRGASDRRCGSHARDFGVRRGREARAREVGIVRRAIETRAPRIGRQDPDLVERARDCRTRARRPRNRRTRMGRPRGGGDRRVARHRLAQRPSAGDAQGNTCTSERVSRRPCVPARRAAGAYANAIPARGFRLGARDRRSAARAVRGPRERWLLFHEPRPRASLPPHQARTR